MLTALEFLKEKTRLTKNCNIICTDCKLSEFKNGLKKPCSNLHCENPEIVIEIIEKWSKDNPVKTYLSVLLENFPNTEIRTDSKTPRFCPQYIFKTKDGSSTCPAINGKVATCPDCWNREYKEED